MQESRSSVVRDDGHSTCVALYEGCLVVFSLSFQHGTSSRVSCRLNCSGKCKDSVLLFLSGFDSRPCNGTGGVDTEYCLVVPDTYWRPLGRHGANAECG
jgi:hypothetical protein